MRAPCFSHDFNIFRKNVTDGVGRLRYRVPGIRVARYFTCLGARARHIRTHRRWRPAPFRRCGRPQGEHMSQSNSPPVIDPTQIDFPPEICAYLTTLLHQTLACTVELESHVAQVSWDVQGQGVFRWPTIFAAMR